MTTIAAFTALFISMFCAMLLPFLLSGKERKAAEDKARARRLAEAKMNARLLRLNL